MVATEGEEVFVLRVRGGLKEPMRAETLLQTSSPRILLPSALEVSTDGVLAPR